MIVGSREHPLKLVGEHDGTYETGTNQSKRKLLHKYTKLTEKQKPDSNFDFKHLKKENISYMLFFHNVIANSNLPSLSVRVVMALYFLISYTNSGLVFITTSRNLKVDDCGFLDNIFIGKGKSQKEYTIDEDSELLSILIRDFNIDINYNQLNKTLKNLHQFHYITVTSITPDNLYEDSKKVWDKENPQQKIGKARFRASLKHINLNFILEDKLLVKKWVGIDEGKKIRTIDRINKAKLKNVLK
jgi:hypothetical protein